MPTVTETEWRFVWTTNPVTITYVEASRTRNAAWKNAERYYAEERVDLRGRGGRVLKAVVTVEVPE